MSKVWNVGNTTVRNPNRIELGLKVLLNENFQNNLYGPTNEARFFSALVKNDVIDSDEANQAKQAWFGRKWRSVMVKLGLITDMSYKINSTTLNTKDVISKSELPDSVAESFTLTPIGIKLDKASTSAERQEIFLRQCIAHELPNPIEPSFVGGKMKPFILFLEVLSGLQTKKLDGLNKIEIGIFLQPFTNHDDATATTIVQTIIEYRRVRANKQGSNEKKKYDLSRLDNVARATNVTRGTLIDYADTTIRYFYLTGLFSLTHTRIAIKSNKMVLVNEILASKIIFSDNEITYLQQYYLGASLPTDEARFLDADILTIKKNLQDNHSELLRKLEGALAKHDLPAVRKIRFEAIEALAKEKEEIYAKSQQDNLQIINTIEYLDNVQKRGAGGDLTIYDPPAFLEWAVWRGFLAIDHITVPAYQTRRFKIDENFLPISTAPGGAAEIILTFNTFDLVVEVTLTSSFRQLVAEGESVRRHVVTHKLESNKRTLGLFISPLTDANTADALRTGRWYNEKESHEVDIVPITIDQFKGILYKQQISPFLPDELLVLLNKCLKSRNLNAPLWIEEINKAVEAWIISK